jgi:hypothetical protein
MPTYAEFGGWVISTIAGWFVVTADTSRGFGVESGRFHAEGDQTFTVLERWAFLAKITLANQSEIMLQS